MVLPLTVFETGITLSLRLSIYDRPLASHLWDPPPLPTNSDVIKDTKTWLPSRRMLRIYTESIFLDDKCFVPSPRPLSNSYFSTHFYWHLGIPHGAPSSLTSQSSHIDAHTYWNSHPEKQNISFNFLMFFLSFLFFSSIFIRYLAHLHFQCYTKSPPYPPTPHSPTHPLPLLGPGVPLYWGI